MGNVFSGGKSLLGFRGTFPRVGKACSVLGGHFPGRENLARFQGNVFPGGKTLLGFRGTFSRAGKACSVSGGHFPEWEKLAAFRGNTFTSGKTLLRSAATLLRAGKACCVPRQHFYGSGNLAAFCGNIFTSLETLLRSVGRLSTIICSPQSFPVRPHQGVCDTPLHFPAKYLHKTAPFITVSSTNKWEMRYALAVPREVLPLNDALHCRIPNE